MESVHTWRQRGTTVETLDGRVFVIAAGEGDATPVLLLHGFPTSSWDFADVFDRLSASRRVVAFDFLGFGLSDKPEAFGYSLFEQADVATLVARAMKLPRVHLVAHDMGTSVATELLARRERGLLPFEIASLTLMNGSVHIEMARLTIGQRLLGSPLGDLFARLNNRATFEAQIRRVFARPPSGADLDAMWALVSRDSGARRLPRIIGYTAERARFARRWVGALERLDVPALVAWGERDPVAVLEIGRALAREIPGAKLVTWPELGHYPQVEDPGAVVQAIEAFLG